jgi:hypothetical protein
MEKVPNISRWWQVMIDQICALWCDHNDVQVWELFELFQPQTLSMSKFEEILFELTSDLLEK